jgi:hypothetical protein
MQGLGFNKGLTATRKMLNFLVTAFLGDDQNQVCAEVDGQWSMVNGNDAKPQ